jgi:hypothetical protein
MGYVEGRNVAMKFRYANSCSGRRNWRPIWFGGK